MRHVVDTAIIGGGPAGISCAIGLQKKAYPIWSLKKSLSRAIRPAPG